jgi:hypothetical protein
MPNWDSIQYTIRGEENELQEIYDALLKMKESEHPDWVGSVLTGLGFDRKSLEGYQLRAFVQDFYLEDGQLVITTEEAWCMTHFPNLLLEVFPNLDILYIEEEPGCQIYETNDAEGYTYPERAKVDYSIHGKDGTEYFHSVEEAIKFAQEVSGTNLRSSKEFREWSNNNPDLDHYCYINVFKVTNEFRQ